jgi:hypothetical protein
METPAETALLTAAGVELEKKVVETAKDVFDAYADKSCGRAPVRESSRHHIAALSWRKQLSHFRRPHHGRRLQ